MTLRRKILIIGIGSLLTIHAVRSAAVSVSPAAGASIWPGHPDVIRYRAMIEIGSAAGKGEQVSKRVLADFSRLAGKAPFAAEPFLVHGAIAATQGRVDRAEKFFIAARTRDPRSAAARYFLADRYLRTGRVAEGLREMAVLARLVPGSTAMIAPFLASFARTPGAVTQLRNMLRSNPSLKDSVLASMANEAGNADLILDIAGQHSPAWSAPWQTMLVNKLTEEGNYWKAYLVWQRIGRLRVGPSLYNPNFRSLPAPPPFNWSLATTGGGYAASRAGGGLDVIYYGREALALASQLTVLSPGTYRFRAEARSTGNAKGIWWIVTCAGSGSEIMQMAVRPGAATSNIKVLPDCPAQRFELRGIPSEPPVTSEAVVIKLALEKAPGL